MSTQSYSVDLAGTHKKVPFHLYHFQIYQKLA
ncbi:hypothetical protein IAD21_02772 [Abditibacteriota bacterium]|nr:hypothetical protein IAD21_02772 [Abditibacteriota bacterium]